MAKSKRGATRRSEKKAKPAAKAAKTKSARKSAAKPVRKAAAKATHKPAAKAAKTKQAAKGRTAAVKKAAKAPAAKKGRKVAVKRNIAKPQASKHASKPQATKKPVAPRTPRKASASRKTASTRVVSGHSAPHAAQHTPHQAAPRKRVHQRPVGGVAARLSVGGGDEQTITREDGRYALPSSVNIDLPKGYRPGAKEEYMNPKQLAYFRQKLKDWRDQLVEESRQTMENLREEVRDVGDDAERATRETENSLELRTRDRYRKLISKIEKALRKIEEGRYGFCEETDEEIGLERLEARPIATLSLDAQERREHLQKQMGD
jgi:DnaK suppressor protein